LGRKLCRFAVSSPSSKWIVNEVGHVSIVAILVGGIYYYFAIVATNLEITNNDEPATIRNSVQK